MASIATMKLMNAIRRRAKMAEFVLTNWLLMRVPALSAIRVKKLLFQKELLFRCLLRCINFYLDTN